MTSKVKHLQGSQEDLDFCNTLSAFADELKIKQFINLQPKSSFLTFLFLLFPSITHHYSFKLSPAGRKILYDFQLRSFILTLQHVSSIWFLSEPCCFLKDESKILWNTSNDYISKCFSTKTCMVRFLDFIFLWHIALRDPYPAIKIYFFSFLLIHSFHSLKIFYLLLISFSNNGILE